MIPQHIIDLQPSTTWRETEDGGYIATTAYVDNPRNVQHGAAVYGRAHVRNGSVISGRNARVCDAALVEHGGYVTGTVCGRAVVRGAVRHPARAMGKCVVPSGVYLEAGTHRTLPSAACGRWTGVYLGRQRVRIGCTTLTVRDWLGRRGKELQQRHGATEQEAVVFTAWIRSFAKAAQARAVKAKTRRTRSGRSKR